MKRRKKKGRIKKKKNPAHNRVVPFLQITDNSQTGAEHGSFPQLESFRLQTNNAPLLYTSSFSQSRGVTISTLHLGKSAFRPFVVQWLIVIWIQWPFFRDKDVQDQLYVFSLLYASVRASHCGGRQPYRSVNSPKSSCSMRLYISPSLSYFAIFK